MIVARYAGAWEAVADYLGEIGTEALFCLPGDDLGLLRPLERTPMRVVLCKDQRNVVFMGIGYTLADNDRPAVCVVGKGPALTNALTGVLEANSTGAPLVLLASGTSAERAGTGAFQELDQLPLVKPLVKWAYRVEHPDRLCWALEKAVFVSTTGAPGPVYIEIPEHLLEAEINRSKPWEAVRTKSFYPDEESIGESLQIIRRSSRPLVLVGGGMRRSNSQRIVERFAEAVGAGIFTTASGRGTVDEGHSLFCGLSGLYAAETMKRLWQETDLVITLGSRLEETAVLGWEVMGSRTSVIQVNLEPRDFSLEFSGERVLGDGAAALEQWLRRIDGSSATASKTWSRSISKSRASVVEQVREHRNELRSRNCIYVAEVLEALERLIPTNRILVQENGLQDMWSYFYPYYSCGSNGGSVLPSEQTSLGFGAAAASGVKLAVGDRPVVAFVGDGAFNIFRSDLLTVLEQKLPLIYVVLKNGGYGWLQNQLNQQGGVSRFRFASAPPRDCIGMVRHPQLEHIQVPDKEALDESLQRAYSATLQGRTAILEVTVHLEDVPPGVQELHGDSSGKERISVEN